MPSPSFTPIAISPSLSSLDLINFILRHHTSPTTLIICSTRETFLQDIQAAINHTHPQDPSNTDTSSDENNHPPPTHPLLFPTLHLLARSSTVTLAFAPTVAHLRAYIATTYFPTPHIEPDTKASANTTSIIKSRRSRGQYPMLAIWGLANLHRSTAEHSAQGLSRSLAVAVEAAKRAGQRLVLAESRALDGEIEEEGDGGEGDAWSEQVPLMSGSLRFGRENRVWAGKTVEVRRVVGRWCRFVRVHDGG